MEHAALAGGTLLLLLLLSLLLLLLLLLPVVVSRQYIVCASGVMVFLLLYGYLQVRRRSLLLLRCSPAVAGRAHSLTHSRVRTYVCVCVRLSFRRHRSWL